MPAAPINITLGTAGHIDHGKTALVKSLTGCETDRLKEERERGMSIDLGYAPCTIANLAIGIVDVPGHEHFIKTMVAGAAGMDGVILVVAADDGVMPQTREHLDILTLLGLRHGLVALTKVDRATPEQIDAARAAIAQLVQGTFLESAPVVGVSNVTGEGFDIFYERLFELVKRIEPRRCDGVFRVPVDRAFSAQGFGTVVAGIPVAGSAAIGEEVVLLPHGWTGQIRRLEAYGRNTDKALAGQCMAINVSHWDHREIGRGDVLTVPGFFSPRQWFVCQMRVLPNERLSIKSGSHVSFHTGTNAVPAAIYPVSGDRLVGGETRLVQIRTQRPVVAGPGDFFIVRSPSPLQTIGGGAILDAMDGRLPRHRSNEVATLDDLARVVRDEAGRVEHFLKTTPGLAADAAELAVRAKIPRSRTQEILQQLAADGHTVPLAAGRVIHQAALAAGQDQLAEKLKRFHAANPDSPGMTLDAIRQELPFDRPVLDAIVSAMKKTGKLRETNQRLALAEHRISLADEDSRALDAVDAAFRERMMNPPSMEEAAAAAKLAPPAAAKAVQRLLEQGRLVRIAPDILFHREAVDAAREKLVAFLRKEGKLESVQFKYLLDTSRKYAIPLLDYFDRVGVTRRAGYTRLLKTP